MLLHGTTLRLCGKAIDNGERGYASWGSQAGDGERVGG